MLEDCFSQQINLKMKKVGKVYTYKVQDTRKDNFGAKISTLFWKMEKMESGSGWVEVETNIE